MTASTNSGTAHTYAALDGWRGICAVLVAVFHCRTSGYLDGLSLVRNSYLFVDFFFVLSGFVVSHAYLHRLDTRAEVATMIWRRFARLWPLHVALLAIFVALELVSGLIASLTGIARSGRLFDPASANLIEAIPTHLLMLHSLGLHDRPTWNVPSWSISAEFCTYAVFAVAVSVARGRTALIAVLLACLGALVVMTYSRTLMAVHHDLGYFRCLYGFFLGHLAYLAKNWRVFQPAGGRTFYTGLELAALLAVTGFVAWAGATRASFAAPLVMGLAVLVFARERGALSDWLRSGPVRRLGQWSYSIYMVHALVLAVLHRVLSVAGKATGTSLVSHVTLPTGVDEVISFASPLAMDALTLGYLAVTVAVAAATWRLIEMPAQRWLNALPLPHRWASRRISAFKSPPEQPAFLPALDRRTWRAR